MKTLNLVSFQKRQNISGKPIFICVVVRCQLCRKLSLFHVALQISTHAFVRESIKNGSFVFADELQYSDISINMSLFASITMMLWLSNTRVECICCSRSQPHAFSWLYYVIYAEERKRVAHVAPWLTERLEEANFNKPAGRVKIPIHFNYGNLFYNTCSNSRTVIGLF